MNPFNPLSPFKVFGNYDKRYDYTLDNPYVLRNLTNYYLIIPFGV